MTALMAFLKRLATARGWGYLASRPGGSSRGETVSRSPGMFGISSSEVRVKGQIRVVSRHQFSARGEDKLAPLERARGAL